MAQYIGFSTIGKLFPPFTLSDIELVKQDLLNEFNTRLGERAMQPQFGTIIYDILMNPIDEFSIEAIKDDAVRIVKKDPRVQLANVVVKSYDDAVLLDISLFWSPNKIRESLFITYQKETETPIRNSMLQLTTSNKGK